MNQLLILDALPAELEIEDKVLHILIDLCSFITKPAFASEVPSENDCLAIWKSIFDIIIMKISNHSGEQMLEATKVIKKELSRESAEYASLRTSGDISRRKGQERSVRASKIDKQRGEAYQYDDVEDGDDAGASEGFDSPDSDDDYTPGAKRQPKSLQSSKVSKQCKYDYRPEDDGDAELSDDGLRHDASSHTDELVARPEIASRWKEMQEPENHEDVEYSDVDYTGYSSSDLYDPDDLSHLTRLRAQEEEVEKLKSVKCRPFDVYAKKSFQRRYESLGPKWVLSTGKVVEDKLYKIGQESEFYSPIHSFMVDCNDTQVARSFTKPEWDEICGQWPTTQIPAKTVDYVESFSDVESPEDLENLLKRRPEDIEEQLVFRCLEDWLHIYTDDPSPFLITERLSESYWQEEVWGVTRKLAKGFVNCKMLPGEKAGVESKERQNRIKASKGVSNTRACYGKKGDLFCRSFDEPMRDWAVIEAAKVWNIHLGKYTIESSTKLPRQLHDMLMHRTKELGGVDRLRNIAVPGLVMGGPVVQSLNLCWGRGGVNITRFRRGRATRVESTMDNFGMSLSAVYVLMMFRAEIGHFLETFNAEQKKIQKKERLRWILLFEGPAEDSGDTPGELLCSSP